MNNSPCFGIKRLSKGKKVHEVAISFWRDKFGRTAIFFNHFKVCKPHDPVEIEKILRESTQIAVPDSHILKVKVTEVIA